MGKVFFACFKNCFQVVSGMDKHIVLEISLLIFTDGGFSSGIVKLTYIV